MKLGGLIRARARDDDVRDFSVAHLRELALRHRLLVLRGFRQLDPDDLAAYARRWADGGLLLLHCPEAREMTLVDVASGRPYSQVWQEGDYGVVDSRALLVGGTMEETLDRDPWMPGRFLVHLREACEAAGAPFDEAAVRRTLAPFDVEFRTCTVRLAASSKPGSGVRYRFLYDGSEDLTARAREAGLIDRDVELERQVLGAFHGAARAGLDFDAASGLAAVRTSTGGPVPIERVSALPAVPDSVRGHLAFLESRGLRDVFFVAAGLRTMSLCFRWDPACRSRAWIRSMPGGADAPVDAILAEGVGTTWSWDRPEMLAWSLHARAVPRPDVPARLAAFRDRAPTLNDGPRCGVAWSFAEGERSVELEKGYARNSAAILL